MNNLPRYKTLDMWHYRNLRKKLNRKVSIMMAIPMVPFLLFIIACAVIDGLISSIDFNWIYVLMFVYIIIYVGIFIWFCIETAKLFKYFKVNKREGRFSTLIYTKFNDSIQLYNEVCNVLQQMDYHLENYNGEEVFCCKGGSVTSWIAGIFPKYIKFQIQGNVIIVTCWIYNGKEYALGDYPGCESLTIDMDNLSNYFDF